MYFSFYLIFLLLYIFQFFNSFLVIYTSVVGCVKWFEVFEVFSHLAKVRGFWWTYQFQTGWLEGVCLFLAKSVVGN